MKEEDPSSWIPRNRRHSSHARPHGTPEPHGTPGSHEDIRATQGHMDTTVTQDARATRGHQGHTGCQGLTGHLNHTGTAGPARRHKEWGEVGTGLYCGSCGQEW